MKNTVTYQGSIIMSMAGKIEVEEKLKVLIVEMKKEIAKPKVNASK